MAKRRMISLDVIGTDKFLALSIAAKGVYMCLTGKADDDGFVASALTTTLISRGTEADLNELVDTGYLIRFDSGIYLIRHWPLSNHVQNDRYTATLYKKEMASVVIYDHVYYLPDDPEYIALKSIPDTKPKRSVSKMDTQVSKGKNSKSKDSKDKPSEGKDTATLTPPTPQELYEYALQIGYDSFNPDTFLAYYNAHDWKTSNGNPVTDWRKLVDLWKAREKDHGNKAPSPGSIFTDFCEQQDYDMNELEKLLVDNE